MKSDEIYNKWTEFSNQYLNPHGLWYDTFINVKKFIDENKYIPSQKSDKEEIKKMGKWIDYQTGKSYDGGWQKIEAGKLPVVVLVRDGTVLPQIKLAQSTLQMDWSQLDLVVFAKDVQTAKGLVYLPADKVLRELSLTRTGDTFKLANDPFTGKVTWKILLAKSVK